MHPDGVDVIVIHSVSAVEVAPDDPFNRGAILKIFCGYGVSSHYLIERDGTTLRLVPEEMKAWHAGGSIMPEPDGRRMVNEFSIGIELAGPGPGGFAELQYHRCAVLCADIERRNGRRFAYVGHEEIAGELAVSLGLRPAAKTDPGSAFDWQEFFGLLAALR